MPIIKFNYYTLMGVVCFFYTSLALLIIVQISNSLSTKSDIQSAFITGGCTILGAFFVIIAAKIQADGVKEQIEANKNAAQCVENMKYVGWCTLLNSRAHRHVADFKNRINAWKSITADIKSFLNTPPEGYERYKPMEFNIDNADLHLIMKLPRKFISALSVSGGYKEIIMGIDECKNILFGNYMLSAEQKFKLLNDKIAEINNSMESLMNYYEQVLDEMDVYLNNLLAEHECEIIEV